MKGILFTLQSDQSESLEGVASLDPPRKETLPEQLKQRLK